MVNIWNDVTEVIVRNNIAYFTVLGGGGGGGALLDLSGKVPSTLDKKNNFLFSSLLLWKLIPRANLKCYFSISSKILRLFQKWQIL